MMLVTAWNVTNMQKIVTNILFLSSHRHQVNDITMSPTSLSPLEPSGAWISAASNANIKNSTSESEVQIELKRFGCDVSHEFTIHTTFSNRNSTVDTCYSTSLNGDKWKEDVVTRRSFNLIIS